MRQPEEIKHSSSTQRWKKKERDSEKELEKVNYRKKTEIEQDKKKAKYLNFLRR
jgi:hypothetical protein